MLRVPHTQESICLSFASHEPPNLLDASGYKNNEENEDTQPSPAVSSPASALQFQSATCEPGGRVYFKCSQRTCYKLRPMAAFHGPYYNTGS